MSRPDSRIIIQNIASRSPSPDPMANKRLLSTKPIQTKTPDRKRQKIPLIQDIANLTKENLKLKQLLSQNDSASLKRQLSEKDSQINDLKKQLSNDKANRRLLVTLTDPPHSSLRSSVQRKRPVSMLEDGEKQQQAKQLKKKILDLSKDNEQLRKSLLARSIRTSDIRDIDFNKVRNEVLNNFNAKLVDLQAISNNKIKSLQEKIESLQKQLKGQQSSLFRTNKKITLISSLKKGEGSTITKRDSKKFQTPRREDRQSNLQAQLSVSKNNIIELQKQNQRLLVQNAETKRAYEDLLKKSHHYSNTSEVHDFPRVRSFQTQHQLNQMLLENQSLKDTLHSLRNNIQILQNENHKLRVKLTTFDPKKDDAFEIASTVNRESLDELNLNNKKQQLKINKLEKDIQQLREQRSTMNRSLQQLNSLHTRSKQDVRALEDENLRLKQQNELLRGNITELSQSMQRIKSQMQASIPVVPQLPVNRGTSKLDQIWNELTQARKRIDELELKNQQLQKQLAIKENTTLPALKQKQDEITKLKYQLERALLDQRTKSAGENDELKRQLTALKGRLNDADKMIQQAGNIDRNNKMEVESMLISLQQLKRMIDRVSFQQLEVSLRQVGSKYKFVIQQKIRILRSLKQKTNEQNRLLYENQKLRQEIVDANSKYINQKSQKQQLESQLQQQTRDARILKEQVRELNNTLNQYIKKKIEFQNVEQSIVRQLDGEVVQDSTQRNIGQVKELQNQIKMVSSKLEDLMRKINRPMSSNRL